MWEGKIDRFDDAAPRQVVEVGHVAAAGPMPVDHRVVQRAAPDRHRRGRVGRQIHVLQALGDADVVLMRHAGHAFTEGAHEIQVGLRQPGWFVGLGHARRQQLRVGLWDVIALHEGGRRQLPIHRKPTRLPPLDAHRFDFPGVVDRREWLEAVPQSRGFVIEVDPRAAAPEFTSDRNQAEVVRVQVVLVEFVGPQYEGIASVDAPAPAVERAHEGTPIPVAFHQLYATVAAGIVVGMHVVGIHPHHDDGFVEDLVLDEVAGLGDLFDPARHLPDAWPEQFLLELVELQVVVPLLGYPVGGLDRPRYRQRLPIHPVAKAAHSNHLPPSPSSVTRSVMPAPASNARECASCTASRSDREAVPDRIRLCADTCSRPGGPGNTR